MTQIITDDIIIAIGIFIIGMIAGICCIAIPAGGPSRLTGIITTTSEGDLCGLPGAVETEGLGIIKKPPCRKGQDPELCRIYEKGAK